MRNRENPILINLHMAGIPTEIGTIKEFPLVAQISIPLEAIVARVIRISDRTDSNNISNFNSCNFGANHSDLPNYFMTRTARIIALTSILSDCCNI